MTATLAGFTVGDRVRVAREAYDCWPVGSVGTVASVWPAGVKRGFWDGYRDGQAAGGIYERYEPDKIAVRFGEKRVGWMFDPADLEHETKENT